MRIVLATKEHLPVVIGGGQLTVHHLARALDARGHDVTVLARGRRGAHPDGFGYPVVRFPAAGAALSTLVDELRPDVVVVNVYGARTELTESLLEAAGGVPAVLYLHDVGGAALAADRHRDVAGVAAVSAFVAQLVAARGGVADVIHPVIDPADYRVPTTRRKVLFVNPANEKGLYMARALAALEPQVEFVWARCWALRPDDWVYIESEARRLGNVEVRPQALDPAAIYGDARVLLVPSVLLEAYGRVAREALTSGIPVLAAAYGGLPEAVGDGGVLMAPFADPAEWAAALRALLDDEAEYARQVARAEREAATGATSAAVVGERFERLLERAA